MIRWPDVCAPRFAAASFLATVTAIPTLALARAEVPLDPATSELLRTLLVDRVGYLALGALFLAIGVAIFLLALGRAEFRDDLILLFGVMSLLWGLRFAARSPAVQLAVGGTPLTWALLTRYLTYLSAPTAFAFVWRLFGSGWRSSLRIITWIALAFATVGCVLLGIVPDPDLLIHAFNFLMLTCIATIALNLLRPRTRGNPALRTLVAGGLGSLLFVILENLRSLGLVGVPFSVEWIGVVVLYGTLADVTVRHLVDVEQKLAALRQELAAAAQIQTAILPPAPPSHPGLAVAMRYLPMTEVAGDFFDFAPLDADRIGILIADVSGHGVPAALIASMVKVAFQVQTGRAATPAQVMAGMNEMLGPRLEGRFVTASYACIDTSARTMHYSGAGHPPFYLRSHRGDVESLPSTGLILGPFPDARYDDVEKQLQPGDRILMYTDGVVEAINDAGEEFGERRLQESLAANVHLSADTFADQLVHDVRAWSRLRRDASFADDLTLIVIDILDQPTA